VVIPQLGQELGHSGFEAVGTERCVRASESVVQRKVRSPSSAVSVVSSDAGKGLPLQGLLVCAVY
jgi:hypothetical protein